MGVGSWKQRAAELEGEVYALYFALRDDRTPVAAKAVIVGIVAYVVSPIDPIPDVVPVIGYLDELVVLPFGIALARRLVPEAVLAEHRDRATEELDVGTARWVVAGLVVLFWAGLVLLVARAFW